MTRILMAIALAALASACSSTSSAPANEQIASAAQKVQPGLIAACNTAMQLAPVAGSYAPFIVAGCGTAAAVDKLAADPSSTEWVNGLVASVKKLKGAPPVAG